MSQFRDTFTKEEQREPLLDYDDSAFLFYLCTVGFCTLAPWTFFSLRRLLSPQRRLARLYPAKSRSGAVLLHCSCSLCNQKRAAELQQYPGGSSGSFFGKLLDFLLHPLSSFSRGKAHNAASCTNSTSTGSTDVSSHTRNSKSSAAAISVSSVPTPSPASHSAATKKKQPFPPLSSLNEDDETELKLRSSSAASAPAAAVVTAITTSAGGGGKNSSSNSGSRSNCVRKKFRSEGVGLWGILEVLLLLAGWIGLATLCYNLPEMKNLKTFDPFDILELQIGASNREIKKAYRLMSLKYHPDKNANDPTSAAKFILVAKAYQTLTDPTAKANYEKYGNPDGPGTMKVGMGLPRFLVEEKYQLLVLACFFLFLLVLLPLVFICYYQRQKKYAPNGVLVETLQFLTHYMTEGSRLKNCPEYLAASGESRALKTEKADDKEMQQIVEHAVEPKKRALTNPVIVRNYFLIVGHMQRLHCFMSERLRDILDDLLRDAMPITHCMLEICVLSDWLHAARAVLDFRRCLVQALDGRASTLLQIPHFTADLVRHCHRGKNATRELADFLRQDPEDRKGLLEMSAAEQLDVQAFTRCVSRMRLSATVSVEDEEEIIVGDIATCSIELLRTNLKDGEAAGAVHAPLLPMPKYEEWWLFVVDRTEAAATGGFFCACTYIHAFVREVYSDSSADVAVNRPHTHQSIITLEMWWLYLPTSPMKAAFLVGEERRILNFHRTRSLEKVIEEKVQFRVSKAGKHVVTVMALCDSYAGCDCSVEVEYRAYHPDEKPRDVWVHPEDVRLDEEPTLFQQMLGDMYNSSDEEEVFDVEEGARVVVKKKAAETAAAAAGGAAAAAAGCGAAAAKEGGGEEERVGEKERGGGGGEDSSSSALDEKGGGGGRTSLSPSQQQEEEEQRQKQKQSDSDTGGKGEGKGQEQKKRGGEGKEEEKKKRDVAKGGADEQGNSLQKKSGQLQQQQEGSARETAAAATSRQQQQTTAAKQQQQQKLKEKQQQQQQHQHSPPHNGKDEEEEEANQEEEAEEETQLNRDPALLSSGCRGTRADIVTAAS